MAFFFVYFRFLSAVRAVAARCKLPFALRPGLSQEDVIRTKETTKERRASVKDKGKDERKALYTPLNRSRGRHEVGRGEEQWSPPSFRLLGPRSQLLQELPQLRLRHLAHSILLGRHPPSHIRGGEKV